MTNQKRDSFGYLLLIIGSAILALTSIYLKFNGLQDLGFFIKLIIIIIGSFILTIGSVVIVIDKSFSIRLLKIIGTISIGIGILISVYYIIKSFEWVWIVNREEMIWSTIVFLFKFIFLCIKIFFSGFILIIAGFLLIKGAQIIPEPLSPDENTEKCGECNGTGVKINIIEKKVYPTKAKEIVSKCPKCTGELLSFEKPEFDPSLHPSEIRNLGEPLLHSISEQRRSKYNQEYQIRYMQRRHNCTDCDGTGRIKTTKYVEDKTKTPTIETVKKGESKCQSCLGFGTIGKYTERQRIIETLEANRSIGSIIISVYGCIIFSYFQIFH